MKNANQTWLTVREVAKRRKVHYLTAWGWVSRRLLPSTKLGNLHLVSVEDVKKFRRPKPGRPRKEK